jgi:hypothetical protein
MHRRVGRLVFPDGLLDLDQSAPLTGRFDAEKNSIALARRRGVRVPQSRHYPAALQGQGPQRADPCLGPGCATGEEAYTIAILLLEEASQHQPRRPCKCSAPTSIPARWLLLEKAATPIAIEVDVNEERLRRFFNHDVDHYRVRQDVPGKSATDNLRAH